MRMVPLALDAITSFSSLPLRITLFVGLMSSVVALLLLINTIWQWGKGDVVIGWSSLMTAVVFFGGLQMTFLGVVGNTSAAFSTK